MILATLNAAGKTLKPVQQLDRRRRRLSQVIGRHVDRRRPHMIAVQRMSDPLQPIEEAWVQRGWKVPPQSDAQGNIVKQGVVKPWPRRYLPADAIVVIVYLPLGGGGASAGRGGKSPLGIALGIAAVALVAFSGPLGLAAAGALGMGATAGTVITAGLVLGGSALLSLASRSKANKQATDTTQIYGVAGGGNLPKPGDRIPRGYGRSWMKPDLSQPDFSQYDGDDQILFKRQTIGVGKYHVYQVRAGKQVIWEEGVGFAAPFDDARNAIEFVRGTASSLVPNSNIAASGVGGLLPRPQENPQFSGPYLINQRGALVSRLQIDFQFPQGISRVDYLKTTTRSNQPAAWAVYFEYAPINEAGAIVGPWQVLYNGNSGAEGARFATHPLRYTRFLDVPPGRYAVRGRNVQPDTSANTTGTASIDAAQWDAASGWVADAAIRDNVTEVCLRIYATKATGAAAFGEIEVDAAAIIPVWNGSGWTDQETSKAVWAFLDVMRDQDYGGALPDDQLDLGTALGYANLLSEFDTFDGTIRGPVSVYEAAATVLLPMRAEPVHLGRYWSLVRDEPKSVRRHVITRRQMLKGSTQLTFDLDTSAGAGHVIGEFDDGGDYRSPNQTTAIYGEASLTPTRQRWTGVRTFDHAQHLTRWRAAAGAFRRQSTPFGVEMEGRIYKRGDSIAVDQWFLETRKMAGVVSNDGNTLFLDADITIQSGDAVVLRDRTGREWGPLGVGQGAGLRQIVLDGGARASIEAATGIPLVECLSDGRGEMTPVLVGPLATLTENYLIQSVAPNGPDRAQVEALIDDVRVWEAIGAAPVVPPIGSGGLRDPESPRIISLTANQVQIAAGLRCDYAIQPGRGCISFEVGLSYDDGGHYEEIYSGPLTVGTKVLNPVDPTDVMLRARAFGSTGLPGPYFYTALSLGESKLAGSLVSALEEVFEGVEQDFKELQLLINELARQAQAIIDDAIRQGDSAQKQLAAAVGRLRDEVREIAEAAATVEGANFESRQLLKVTLEGRVQDAFAAILHESELRISETEALAREKDVLAVRLGTSEAAIETEKLARIDADGVQAGQITTAYSRLSSAELNISGQASAQQGLTTRVSNTEGNFVSLSQSYTTLNSQIFSPTNGLIANANALSQLTTRTDTIDGRVTSASDQIVVLSNRISDPVTGLGASASAISSLTSSTSGRLTNVEGVVNAQAAALVSLANEVFDPIKGNLASSTAIDTLNTSVRSVDGRIDVESSKLTQLTTRVGGNEAGLSVVARSTNGIMTQYGVLGTINGQTGGFTMFGAVKLDSSVAFNMEILGSLVVTESITARALSTANLITASAQIGNLVVGNLQIADGAVTQCVSDYQTGNTASVSIAIRRASANVQVHAIFKGNSAQGTNSGPGALVIQRNGTFLDVTAANFAIYKPDSGNLQFYIGPMCAAGRDAPGAGVHTYQATHTNGAGIGGMTIIVTELSK